MKDLILVLIIVAAVGGAIWHIIRKKKAGAKCIGCPYAGCCSKVVCLSYRLPNVSDKDALQEYLDEYFLIGEREVILAQDLLLEDCEEWIKLIENNATVGNEEFGKSLLLLCHSGEKLVGVLCVRYELSEDMAALYGHIGYSVRPLERNKGFATQMLKYGLDLCKDRGLKRAILGCHSTNQPSIAVISKCGGQLKFTSKEDEEETNNYYEIIL